MRQLGRVLTTCGAILVAFYIVAQVHSHFGANIALAQFDAETTRRQGSANETLPDMSLWSEGRIKGFRESLGLAFDPPLAVLRIPRIGLEAPVLRGTDDASLNRGLGWIEGMALPGTTGNVGVAGHRDGFFRRLKDVAAGDVIELSTADGAVEYVVSSTQVIQPEDVHVLAPTDSSVLTLVTCYPFYHVGPAPQRFIVRAAVRGEGASADHRPDIPTAIPDHRSGSVVSQQPSTNKQQHGGAHQ